jgi:hypothetical protein
LRGMSLPKCLFVAFQKLTHANSRRGQSCGTYQSVHKVDPGSPRSRCQAEAQEGK